jgi:hypothetical protein
MLHRNRLLYLDAQLYDYLTGPVGGGGTDGGLVRWDGTEHLSLQDCLNCACNDLGYMSIGGNAASAMLDITQATAAITGLEINGAADRSAPLLQLVEGSGTPTEVLMEAKTAASQNLFKLHNTGDLEIGYAPGNLYPSLYVYNPERTAYGRITLYDLTIGNIEIKTTYASGHILLIPGATSGKVGINTTPEQMLDVLGNILIQTNKTNNTLKTGSIFCTHYDTSEEDIAGFTINADSTTNVIYWGGGNAATNAATSHVFYTAANNTTLTGSVRMFISPVGLIGMGTSSPQGELDIGAKGIAGFATYVANLGDSEAASDKTSMLQIIGRQDATTSFFAALSFHQVYDNSEAYDRLCQVAAYTGATVDDGQLHFGTTLAGTLGGSKMVLDENGYLGLNKIAPAGHLHQVIPAAGTIGHIIELATTPTANALEVNTSGGSGGDLASINSLGYGSFHALDLVEIATPANPAVNTIRTYAIEDADFTVLETITDLGVINRINQDSFRIARNDSGGTLAKGTAVYYSDSTGNKPDFRVAQANSITTMPAIGILNTSPNNGAFAEVMIIGRITGIKTDYTNAGEPTYAPVADWAEGDALYVNTAVLGGLQNSKPLHPNFSQWMGTIEVVHATTGVILVKVAAMLGLEDGTNSNTFTIGDTAAGTKSLKFDGAADAQIDWDGTQIKINHPTWIGDGVTNYAAFAADGELTLAGTARCRLGAWINAESFKLPATNPASKIEYGIGTVLEFSDEAVNYEHAWLKIAVPKDIDTSAQPILIVGWSCPTADPGDDSVQVRWEVAYLWRGPDEAMDAAAEATVTDNYTTSETAKGLVITQIQLANLAATDSCLSAILTRRSDNAGDTANAVAANVSGACLYYVKNKLGEAT